MNEKQRSRSAREALAQMDRIRALAEAEVKEMRARLDAMCPLPAPRTEQLS